MKGRVLVVGGSEDYVGAPYLAGMAALRAGAESVIVMAPEKVAWVLNALSPDLMTRKLKGKFLSNQHARVIREQAKTADVLVIGNGAGIRTATASLLRSLARLTIAKVIDADALKALPGTKIRNAVLTPNPGEWKILKKNSNIKTLLGNGNVIVKKGSPSEIWTRSLRISVRTNSGLQKAGTGDVLAGLCAGYLSSGLPLLQAARRACKRGDEMARLLKKRTRFDFLASDLL